MLAVLGGLATLVESASLAFLFTFSVVCGLAFREKAGSRLISGPGFVLAVAPAVGLTIRLVNTNPITLLSLAALVVIAVFRRPILLRHVRTEGPSR